MQFNFTENEILKIANALEMAKNEDLPKSHKWNKSREKIIEKIRIQMGRRNAKYTTPKEVVNIIFED